jgi:hypothetical protein
VSGSADSVPRPSDVPDPGRGGVTRRGAGAAWLALEPDPVLVFLHEPRRPALASRTAVLLCPPFGWEEICSYRARRAWANALADEGVPAARLTLPSSGDSGGSPNDAQRVRAWTRAVGEAAVWLRELTGTERVVAIGIGLGGMLAVRAISEGAPIDDLVLWGVPARGRVLVRELRAYAEMVAARRPEDRRPESPEEDESEYIGFVLSQETRQFLEQLDLTTLDLPAAPERQALLLGRDGLAVDKRLREHLEGSGVAVSVKDTADYAAMMLHPQESQTPWRTIAETIDWLAGSASPAPRPGVKSPRRERSSIELRCGDGGVRETPIEFEGEQGRMFGILTESLEGERAGVCAVWLNGGALPHPGPNRSWVEVARRWAARGIPTVRVDLHGIGEADGDEPEILTNFGLYAPPRTEQALAVMHQLAERGLPQRFVLGGLCSGAYWSLQAALANPRVAGVMLINLYAFVWSEALVAERDTRDSLEALRGYAWRRLARGDVRAAQLKAAIASIRPARLRARSGYPVEQAQAGVIEAALDRLRDQRTETLLLLSRAEGLHDQLARLGVLERLDVWPNLAVERIPSTDHMFRALWLQRTVHQSLDLALERVLTSVGRRS